MGTLYLVATPIGNLEDISLRALRVLGEVDVIAAEDTRRTAKLLAHYDLETPLISYHEHSGPKRVDDLIERLDQGDAALVSDAGSPLISDPGYELIRAAIDRDIPVVPVPGPSAVIAALSASGLPTDSFLFLGYLPRKAKERRTLLERHARTPHTLVLFEVPHRLQEALADLVSIFGAERRAAVCRELTKMHEQITRGTLADISEQLAAQEERGEYTLIVAGSEGPQAWTEDEVRQALKDRIAMGDRPTEAARWVAASSGWNRQQVYRFTLEEE